MIDYEKLRTAHELADKLAKEQRRAITVSIMFMVYGEQPEYYLYRFGYDNPIFKGNIDKLIDELKELTRPEPKYKVGDMVWVHTGNDTESMIIGGIDANHSCGIWYHDHSDIPDFQRCGYLEEQLYSSREALIDAQIQHWQSLKDESVTDKFVADCSKFDHQAWTDHSKDESVTDCNPLECEHEWVGDVLQITQCKKCGVGYR